MKPRPPRRLLTTVTLLAAALGTTLAIAAPAHADSAFAVQLCADTFTQGTCQTFDSRYVVGVNGSVPFLSNYGLADAADSMVVVNQTTPPTYVYLYSGTSFTGRCQQFTGTQGQLAGGWVGADAAESMGWSTTPGLCGDKGATIDPPVVCKDTNYTNNCVALYYSVAYLGNAWAGDDQITSVQVPAGSYLTLFQDPNFTGQCQEFGSSNASLVGSVIGNDQASSAKVSTTPGGCDQGNFVKITTGRTSINHWQTFQMTYYCPPEYPKVGDPSDWAKLPFENVGSGGVTASMSGGGYNGNSLTISYGNPNVTGSQTAGIKLYCHNDLSYDNDDSANILYYGGFTHPTGQGNGNRFGDEHTTTEGTAAGFEFTGDTFQLWGSRGPGYGRIHIVFDSGSGDRSDVYLDCGATPFAATSQLLFGTVSLPEVVTFPNGQRHSAPDSWNITIYNMPTKTSYGRMSIDTIASSSGGAEYTPAQYGCPTYSPYP